MSRISFLQFNDGSGVEKIQHKPPINLNIGKACSVDKLIQNLNAIILSFMSAYTGDIDYVFIHKLIKSISNAVYHIRQNPTNDHIRGLTTFLIRTIEDMLIQGNVPKDHEHITLLYAINCATALNMGIDSDYCIFPGQESDPFSLVIVELPI